MAKVKRYVHVHDDSNNSEMKEIEYGGWVSWEDYIWLSEYTDRLVELGKLPCLPKDLENLRTANLALAEENVRLKREVEDLNEKIEDLDDENARLKEDILDLNDQIEDLDDEVRSWRDEDEDND